MGATNQTSEGKKFFKLKPIKGGENSGELRFFEQVKTNGAWGDGAMFNTLSGKVTEILIKEFEWEGETVKNLSVVLSDNEGIYEFQLGMQSTTARGILNTLAGGNGFNLAFVCGKVKNGYAQLYINKLGNFSKEEARTNWKYSPENQPKVTVTTDEDGNKIFKGKKVAEKFWIDVFEVAKEHIALSNASGIASNIQHDDTGIESSIKPVELPKTQRPKKQDDFDSTTPPDDDLPF